MEAPVQTIVFHPIGVIHTPFREQAGAPIQPACAEGAEGTVTVFDPYVEALADLAGFERIWLLYHFDRSRAWESLVVPYRDDVKRGLFATRAPARPNPVGLSVVRLVSVVGNTLHVQDMDVLDGAPLLDIKPYMPQFDAHPGSRSGWLDASASTRRVADDRFDRAPPGA
jgi:tRNA-Thr(GGU) m(6)t(6)A37 methyltransferase TsaA